MNTKQKNAIQAIYNWVNKIHGSWELESNTETKEQNVFFTVVCKRQWQTEFFQTMIGPRGGIKYFNKNHRWVSVKAAYKIKGVEL
ncbi:MAG: hypothetical protein ACUZ8E_17435 [Candidatus Anammoxibacter sp.]